MTKGYISIILHSHMPFIRHPDLKDPLEERWLFEGISECYIPLIEVYDKLIKDHVDFKITMSITPTLMTMLEDEYLNKRYLKYLKKSIALSKKEINRTKYNKELVVLAKFYNERLSKILDIYKNYDYNIMNAFRKFDKLGYLEVLTSAATHGLLPLLAINPESVKAQIGVGVQCYLEYMGHPPHGIWLPECAYTHSLDPVLKEYGIDYFISENKAIINASPKSRYGVYAPISLPNGISVFGRDIESSYQVWSDFKGYPGDFDYREFYRDIGYELPLEYIEPYINEDKVRIDTGIKYYRITGNTDNKEYYNRKIAMERIKEHGEHFFKCRVEQIDKFSRHMDQPPIIVCPYDTELFGHWWFEGPDFIDEFIRKTMQNNCNYKLISPRDYLKKYPIVQCSSPCSSSWGQNGDFSVWINPSNQWIYRKIHKCGKQMVRLSNTYKNPTDLQRRTLNQAARELMLAESSDWPFIIKNHTAVEYAVKRINNHVDRFNKLYDSITKDAIDLKYLSQLEKLDNIFKSIDYKIYQDSK